MANQNYVRGWCKHNKKDLCKNWDGKGKTVQEIGDETDCPVKPEEHKQCEFNCGPGKKTGS